LSLAEKYVAEKVRLGIWASRSLQDNQYILTKLLVQMLGNLSCKMIDYANARYVKETLMQLPPYLSKKSEYHGKTINEILSLKTRQKISVTTVNRAIGMYSSLFEYGVKHGYLKTNPFANMKLPKSVRAKDERLPFSKDDLKKIFDSKLYRELEYKKEFHYWLLLLGIYTGCRIGELAGLYVDDVKKIDNVWVISINNEKYKSIKTKSSIRDVPIDDKLIKLGFLDFVNYRK